ncbi:hypothetical protein [Pontibacter litorisediminis]|uniref:hypothetical protein n=1 Tax=Pontibacter litorisediminis TaxID=1846260 RepID=UPI0023ECA931|nr:hypothetical protein [Pontibacter litorisediminis]
MEPLTLPDYLTARMVPGDYLLHITWLRGVSTLEYREGIRLTKQILLENNIRLWLVDSRLLTHVTFEDQQWIMKEIVPLLLESNLQKVARVVKPDVFSYITFENMMRKAQECYNVQGHMEQFTTVESALAWLHMND